MQHATPMWVGFAVTEENQQSVVIGLQKSQSLRAYVLSRRQSWCSFLSLCVYTPGSGRWGFGVDQANSGEGALPDRGAA